MRKLRKTLRYIARNEAHAQLRALSMQIKLLSYVVRVFLCRCGELFTSLESVQSGSEALL